LRYLLDIPFSLDKLLLCLGIVVVDLFVIEVDLRNGIVAVLVGGLQDSCFDLVSLVTEVLFELFGDNSEQWEIYLVISNSPDFIREIRIVIQYSLDLIK
jgi:hypothetical protein